MKRHASLAALSRDHHHALVLAQSLKHDAPERLREGLPRDGDQLVEVVRERFARELEPHFAIEERVLVPRCRSHGGELGAQADSILEQHHAIRAHVAGLAAGPALRDQLDAFGRALDEHVRFEERSWFPMLERELGDEALNAAADSLRTLPVAPIER
jgi:hemerythrin-like domain-containing protein